MAYLILVRHGESIWNAQGLWTGLVDVDLSPTGIIDAKEAGQLIKGIKPQIAFTSKLKRAQHTLKEILRVLDIDHIPTFETSALNERDYGDFTGKNKWEIEKEYGHNQFIKWRRGWDVQVPNGESLKDVYERVVPYYVEHILPKLKSGKNVLVSAHGNSLRALVKYLDDISDKDITKLELEYCEVYIYQINEDGQIISKEVRVKD
ncbi:MAG: 2,3-diphosphoglycerate-dependent phosphoglycerate mutase [Candidatus Daviesbacteria bacterium]|nr:2,3-diphosphoglycerate-dependent phosphoglycerate mutase [Candidatus Daviesbacteria bacterium]